MLPLPPPRPIDALGTTLRVKDRSARRTYSAVAISLCTDENSENLV